MVPHVAHVGLVARGDGQTGEVDALVIAYYHVGGDSGPQYSHRSGRGCNNWRGNATF